MQNATSIRLKKPLWLCILLASMALSLTACANKQDPMPSTLTAENIVVEHPAPDTAHKDDPKALDTLLHLEGKKDKESSAVMDLRPKAIREAAQLVTFQTAMSWRYEALVAITEKYSAIMDTAFNFAPLLMTQGDTLIMPPILTTAGTSMRFENGETVTSAKTTYELLEPAHYIATIPTWREFLLVDAFPEPEKPNPAVLPQNAEERAIWKEAVREAWAQGLHEADQLYADNVAHLTRSYRGVMLYHLLTAQDLLSRVHTASADMGLHVTDNGNKLNIDQKVYRITAPSRFTIPKEARHD